MNIDALLDSPDQITKVLSLDCFDTLLWRKVAEPTDVFYDLQSYPTFRANGITFKQRELAERLARKFAYFQQGNAEVTLEQIFKVGFPSLHADTISRLIAEEIAAESHVCYPFLPVIQLIRKAIALQIKIVIVSSTYFEEKQLRQLLANTLPPDAYQALSAVYCSSDFKIPKHEGLFSQVIDKLGVLPQHILHLGDNPIADFEAPKACGMRAVYITPLPYQIKHVLWLQSVAAMQVIPGVRQLFGLASPFKAIYANVNIDISKPEQLLGYVSLGPILYAFAQFIADKIASLHQAGNKTNIAYVMRDGYLPGLAVETLSPNLKGKPIYISRFTANAAALRSKNDILRYVVENFGVWSIEANLQQLLIPPEMSQTIIEEIRNAKNPELTFTQFVMQDAITHVIIENSNRYFQRLQCYLQKELNLTANETLVLIDIGYRGTIQRLLTPLLQATIPGLDIVGYYFELEDFPEWQLTREGLFDSANADSRNYDVSLLNYTLIEALFSNSGETVIDYSDDGHPIYTKSAIAPAQAAKCAAIQHECLRFIRDAKNYFELLQIDIPMTMLRQTALAELFRIICLLTEDEIRYLRDFKHDVNKKVVNQISIFPEETKYLQSLRRHSVWFLKNSTYALRAAGDLEQVMAFITKKRLLRFFPANADLSVRKKMIPVQLSYTTKKEKLQLTAKPTFDGYFALDIILVQPGEVTIDVNLGSRLEWLQLECVEAMNFENAYQEDEAEKCQDITTAIQLYRLEKKGKNLFKCASQTASIKVKLQLHDKTLVRVVFRPIHAWKSGLSH